MTQANILIVDDETDIRSLIQGILEDEGYVIRQAANSTEAYALMAEDLPDMIILDIWLQNSEHDGLQILEIAKENNPDIPVVMISGHGTIETAVSAIKQGAYDFIEKPFKADRLLFMIERALETAKLKQENRALKKKAEGSSEIIGSSAPMTAMRHLIERVAQTNSRVLITGEAGTGKEIVARAIHRASLRSVGPFLALNCAILHPDRLEQELFGEEGNGADILLKKGLLEQADGGTLLLDEVADMPLETQGKIVRVLQDQQFQRVGGADFLKVDVRIIAATNHDLQKTIQTGEFREDLFYRLNVVPVEVPPLRNYVQDIESLIDYFITEFSTQTGMAACELADNTMAALQSYGWPGNVRQLRNLVERLMILGSGVSNDDNLIRIEQLPAEIIALSNAKENVTVTLQETTKMAVPLREAREIFEREYLTSQIDRFDGNISKMSHFVGMERSALHRKLKQLGISSSSKQNDKGDSGATSARRAKG